MPKGNLLPPRLKGAPFCPFRAKAESCFAFKITARGYDIPEHAGDLGSAPVFVCSCCSRHLSPPWGHWASPPLRGGEGATPVASFLGYSAGKRDLGASSCFVARSAFSSQWIKYPQKPLGNCGFFPTPGSGIAGSFMFASLD